MTEETSQEAIPKPKQYLIMVDEISMAFLSKIIPTLQFCEVQGLVIPDNPNYHLLANPIIKKPEE